MGLTRRDTDLPRLFSMHLCICGELPIGIATPKRNARDSVKSQAFVEQPLPRKAVLADSFGDSVAIEAVSESVSSAGCDHRLLTHLPLTFAVYVPSPYVWQLIASKLLMNGLAGTGAGTYANICISLPQRHGDSSYFARI